MPIVCHAAAETMAYWDATNRAGENPANILGVWIGVRGADPFLFYGRSDYGIGNAAARSIEAV